MQEIYQVVLPLKWDKSIFEYFKITGRIIAVTEQNGKQWPIIALYKI